MHVRGIWSNSQQCMLNFQIGRQIFDLSQFRKFTYVAIAADKFFIFYVWYDGLNIKVFLNLAFSEGHLLSYSG